MSAAISLIQAWCRSLFIYLFLYVLIDVEPAFTLFFNTLLLSVAIIDEYFDNMRQKSRKAVHFSRSHYQQQRAELVVKGRTAPKMSGNTKKAIGTDLGKWKW